MAHRRTEDSPVEQRLAERYARLSDKLARVGYICTGSLMSLYRKCGKSDCGCRDDRALQHGPYHIWTRKERGKTVTRSLGEEQAQRCAEYMENFRRMERIIEEMKQISVRLIEGERKSQP